MFESLRETFRWNVSKAGSRENLRPPIRPKRRPPGTSLQRPLEFARLSQLRWGEGKNLDAFYSTIPVEPEIYRRVQEFYVFILLLSLKDTYGQNDSYYS